MSAQISASYPSPEQVSQQVLQDPAIGRICNSDALGVYSKLMMLESVGWQMI